MVAAVKRSAACACTAGAFARAFALQRLRECIRKHAFARTRAACKQICMGHTAACRRCLQMTHQRAVPPDFPKCIQVVVSPFLPLKEPKNLEGSAFKLPQGALSLDPFSAKLRFAGTKTIYSNIHKFKTLPKPAHNSHRICQV